MNEPYARLDGLVGRKGFAQLRAHELFATSPIVEVMREKVATLDLANWAEEQLARDVTLLVEALRDTLARRYTGLSLLAFAHILVALDYVVRVKDDVPDTREGGYADDLAVVRRVMNDWDHELDDYRAWRLKMEPLMRPN